MSPLFLLESLQPEILALDRHRVYSSAHDALYQFKRQQYWILNIGNRYIPLEHSAEWTAACAIYLPYFV
jgi:hypothetical protein